MAAAACWSVDWLASESWWGPGAAAIDAAAQTANASERAAVAGEAFTGFALTGCRAAA